MRSINLLLYFTCPYMLDCCLDKGGNIYLAHGYFRVRKIGNTNTCNNTFLKTYNQPTGCTKFNDFVVLPDNNIITVGYVNNADNNSDLSNSFLNFSLFHLLVLQWRELLYGQ